MTTSLRRKKKINNWFNRPYYFNDTLKFKILTSFGLAVFVTLFVAFVKPFNIGDIVQDLPNYAFFCGLVTLLDLFIYFFIFRRLFPSFFTNDSWTVGKQILTICLLIIQGCVLVWILNQHFYPDVAVKALPLVEVLKFTLGIGIFPIALYSFIDERYGTYKRSSVSKQVMQEKKKEKPKKTTTKKEGWVTIFATNKKDKVDLLLDNILYVTSSSNYVNFFLKNEDDDVYEKILRKQLIATERDLEEYPQFVRCHKSYIVNTNFVTDLSGNAKGYFFHLDNYNIDIPVSRQFSKEDLLRLI